MLQALARAFLAGFALVFPASGHTTTTGAGAPVWTRAVGFGAVACPDAGFGATANPAHWAFADRAWITGGIGFGGDGSTRHLALALPLDCGWRVGLGAARSSDEIDATKLESWNLALARLWHPRLAVGGVLRLLDAGGDAPETGFGADAGLQFEAWHRSTGDMRLDLGAVLQNAVRPEAPEVARSECRLVAGARLETTLRNHLRLGAAVGCDVAELDRISAGATLGFGPRLDFAAGITSGKARIGAAIRFAAWRLDYALAEAGAPRQALSLRWAWGATTEQRRREIAERESARDARRVQAAIDSIRTERIVSEIEAGESDLERQAFDAAAEHFRRAILWGPEDLSAQDGLRRARRGAFLARADSLLRREDLWSANHLLDQALASLPGDSTIAARLAAVRETIGRAHRTRTEAAEQFRLGLDAYAAQRFVQARRCFEDVLALDPAHAAAAEFVERSRQAHADQVRSALVQSRARLQKHDYSGAAVALEDILAVDPENARVLELRDKIGRALERQQREQQLAEAHRLAEAEREDRSPAPLSPSQLRDSYARGLQLYRAGDLLGAMRAWEHVAEASPEYEEVGQYLLRVYRVVGLESYTEGHLQNAIDIWGKALQLEPGNQQVRRYMNQANAKLRRAQGPGGAGR